MPYPSLRTKAAMTEGTKIHLVALSDLGLFLKSAHTDRLIGQWRNTKDGRFAFEKAYGELEDPWASADPRYRYQANKYAHLMECLPTGRRFACALDIGCGLGTLSIQLAERANQVIGIDIAQAAVDLAIDRASEYCNIMFQQASILELPATFERRFDLVVIADVLYYLPAPIKTSLLNSLATSVAQLLVPGGLCLLADHYFIAIDPASRLSRRIHNAFIHLPQLRVRLEARRPFYVVTLLERVGITQENARG